MKKDAVKLLIGLFISVAIGVSGCGGGGSSSQSTSQKTLSADQAVLESFYMSPNAAYTLNWNLPLSGAPVSTSYFAESHVSMSASPLTNGTQKITGNELSSIAHTLSSQAVAVVPTRYLINGVIFVNSGPSAPINNYSYQGTEVRVDSLAEDGVTTANSNLRSNFSFVPLTGTVASAPSDLAHWLGTLYLNPSLLNTSTTWESGAGYLKYTNTLTRDTYSVIDSGVPTTTGNSPTPFATGTTITTLVNAGGMISDSKTYDMANGSVAVINGVNTYVATNPLSNSATTLYRTFYELNGNVYSGTLAKNGTVSSFNYLVPLPGTPGYTNASANYQIRLNKAAINSLQSAVTF
jgi:hypothetical protein